MKKISNLFLNRKFLSMTAFGQSMFPLIKTDDVVFLKKYSFAKYRVNDFISFKRNNEILTHRVIYKKNNYLITKGDNNLNSDGRINQKEIIGRVEKIKRKNQIYDPEKIYLAQSTVYFQEIIKIKYLLEKQKIDFVFLKGLPLYLNYERVHPHRLYLDCDLLIRKIDFIKAEDILTAFGYKKNPEQFAGIENNYVKVINGFSVVFDLHLEPAFLMTQFSGLEALYPQKLIDQLASELLETKRTVKINGQSFFILNTRYLILYLALHIFHHNFRGAFRYQFLDKVIRKSLLSTNDWQEIAPTINNYQLNNFVYPIFILLKKYYQSPIPHSFLKSIKSDLTNLMNFKNLSIFDDEPRFQAGITRFKTIFQFSPYPLSRKLTIFLSSRIIHFILKIPRRLLFSSVSKIRSNL